MRQLAFLVTLVIIVSISRPCMAQLDEVYDVPLTVHTVDDEWPPWPYIAVDDSGYVYTAYHANWAIETKKLDSIGNSVWTQTICGGMACTPHDIALDANANVYVLGTMDYVFNDTIMGDCNLVLIKYDSAGVYQWTATYPFTTDLHYPHNNDFLGSSEPDAISGQIEVSPDGHTYVWGHRWDRYIDEDNYVSRQKNGFLLIYDYTGNEMTNQTFECPIDKPSRPGVPGDRVEGVHAIDAEGNVVILASTWADIEICPVEPFAGNTLDTNYQDALWIYEAEADGNNLYEDQHFRNNIVWVPCVGGYDGTRSVGISMIARDICYDGIGNKYLFGWAGVVQYGATVSQSFVTKFDTDWNQLWSRPLGAWQPTGSMNCDSAGNLIIASMSNYTNIGIWRIDPYGNVIGPDSYIATAVKMDDAGNSYAGLHGIRKYDADLNTVWSRWWGINNTIRDIEVDRKGNIYLNYTSNGSIGAVVKLEQSAILVVRDAHNDTIPNVEFELIKVSNDLPVFTEDTLGSFTTDSLGQLRLPMVRTDSLLFRAGPGNDTPDTLAIGDTIKVALHVHTEPAVKHQFELATMYSIHLDNAKFDEMGEASFDTVALDKFDVVLDHSEVRYNLLVSVEWDASQPYQAGLLDNIRAASNYLYDITDGQSRLDTVVILDGAAEWDWADVQVHASNATGSYAWWQGMYQAQFPVPIVVPRRDYGETGDNRDSTYWYHPMEEVVPETFRVLIHELGHYGLGFYDEWMFCCNPDGDYDKNPRSPLKCGAVDYYGFMHWMRADAGERGSEMSSATRYATLECRNTEQYRELGSSCWDYWEPQLEGYYEVYDNPGDTIFVPIIKPDDPERELATGLDYLPGPNNNTGYPPAQPDYDVGGLIVFTQPVFPPEPNVKDLHVQVDLAPAGGAEVRLMKATPSGLDIVEQGKTTDNGRIWVLGVNEISDYIDAGVLNARVLHMSPTALAQAAEVSWLYGIGEVTTADSLTITLEPIDGDYPLICEVMLSETDATMTLTAQSMFTAEPSLIMSPSYGRSADYVFSTGTSEYVSNISDSLGYEGSFTITAVDALGNPFSFWADYCVAHLDTTDMRVLGPSRLSVVEFDSADTDIERALLLASPYPVIRAGLDPDAIQAGEAQSLSVYPTLAISEGAVLSVGYDDAALSLDQGQIADEGSLQMYLWDTSLVEWVLIGGYVDTIRNEVWSSIPGPGVYAAFTSQIITDVEDDEYGNILPYRFELSQNYPNPFNPVTTIEYNLPRRSQVSIEIYNVLGQRVRTLVDREESAGSYTVTWNGADASGNSIATGVYLYRFQAGDHIETKKMLLLK